MKESHVFAGSDRNSPGSAAGRTVQPSDWHSTETAAQNLEGQNTHPAMKTEKETAAEQNLLFLECQLQSSGKVVIFP